MNPVCCPDFPMSSEQLEYMTFNTILLLPNLVATHFCDNIQGHFKNDLAMKQTHLTSKICDLSKNEAFSLVKYQPLCF